MTGSCGDVQTRRRRRQTFLCAGEDPNLSPAHEHQGIRDLKPKEPNLEGGRFS